MRGFGTFLLTIGLALPLAPAVAAEKAAVIRAGELKEKPFIDAPTSQKLAASQPVTIISRQGPWAQVEANGTTGWVRMLNLKLQTGAVAIPGKRGGAVPASASLLRTGSSGRTLATGVKGLGEEDIRNSTPDMAEVQQLASLAVDPSEATAHAQQSGLKEHKVDYLKDGGRK